MADHPPGDAADQNRLDGACAMTGDGDEIDSPCPSVLRDRGNGMPDKHFYIRILRDAANLVHEPQTVAARESDRRILGGDHVRSRGWVGVAQDSFLDNVHENELCPVQHGELIGVLKSGYRMAREIQRSEDGPERTNDRSRWG